MVLDRIEYRPVSEREADDEEVEETYQVRRCRKCRGVCLDLRTDPQAGLCWWCDNAGVELVRVSGR